MTAYICVCQLCAVQWCCLAYTGPAALLSGALNLLFAKDVAPGQRQLHLDNAMQNWALQPFVAERLSCCGDRAAAEQVLSKLSDDDCAAAEASLRCLQASVMGEWADERSGDML